MVREIVVPYGHSNFVLRVPHENLVWVVGPKDAEPVADVAEAVRSAVRSPIDSLELPQLVARYGTKTIILVDDGTRPTPQHLILPALLDELNEAGVSDSDITVMIGLGTHRPMTEAERVDRFGPEVMSRVGVDNLRQGAADFVDLGTTPLGIPIQVSRRYLESDLSIAVGNIIPHMYAGWAGGAKMIQPGVSSPLTTAKTHLLAGPRVYEILGQLDNEVHREMDQIALTSGLKFIVNVVLNRDVEVVAVVAGDVIAAHRAGVEIARPIYAVEVGERADIVIAGAHPAERDLWQGFKPLNNCGMLVKDGGTLILLISAPEGIAPDHPQMVELGTTPGEVVQGMVKRGEITDEVGAATYLALDQTRKRLNITLVSDGITRDEATRIGLAVTTDLDAALAKALKRHGDGASIGVVTHGADIVGAVRPS